MKRNHLTLLLLALLFATPGILSYLVYLHPSWLILGKTNKGSLIKQPFKLPPAEGEAALRSKAHWQMVLWSPEDCRENCQKELDKLARLRLALGRRVYEVDIRLLQGPHTRIPATLFLAACQEADIRFQRLTKKAYRDMPGLDPRSAIFLANPDGYLVLAYQAEAEPADIFHDIKQLLK